MPYGFHRYQGSVKDGRWRIERTYPPVSRADLEQMLELASDVDGEEAIRVRSTEEGEEILRQAKAYDFLLRENLPRLQAAKLKLKKADQHLMPFLGARAFLVRFADVWPAIGRWILAQETAGECSRPDRTIASGSGSNAFSKRSSP